MNADGSGVSHGSGKLEIWEGMCGAEKKASRYREYGDLPARVENEEAGRQERLGRVWEAWERGL